MIFRHTVSFLRLSRKYGWMANGPSATNVTGAVVLTGSEGVIDDGFNIGGVASHLGRFWILIGQYGYDIEIMCHQLYCETFTHGTFTAYQYQDIMDLIYLLRLGCTYSRRVQLPLKYDIEMGIHVLGTIEEIILQFAEDQVTKLHTRNFTNYTFNDYGEQIRFHNWYHAEETYAAYPPDLWTDDETEESDSDSDSDGDDLIVFRIDPPGSPRGVDEL